MSLDEALRLDCHLLGLVLQRNQRQHHRTQYFRRLEMIERSIRRHSILSLTHDISALRRQGLATATPADSNINKWVEKVQHTVTHALPEAISRIYHAASALFLELGRSYFVPLCSVFLAIISRIRVILMRLGREAVLLLQKHSYHNLIISWEALLQLFMEIDGPSFTQWTKNVSARNLPLFDSVFGHTVVSHDTATTATATAVVAFDPSIALSNASNGFKIDHNTLEPIIISNQYDPQQDDLNAMDMGQDYLQVGNSSKDVGTNKPVATNGKDRNEHIVSYVKQKLRKEKINDPTAVQIGQIDERGNRGTQTQKMARKDSPHAEYPSSLIVIKRNGNDQDNLRQKKRKKRDKVLDDIFL